MNGIFFDGFDLKGKDIYIIKAIAYIYIYMYECIYIYIYTGVSMYTQVYLYM